MAADHRHVSAIGRSAMDKAFWRILPLILIPQIIMSGALIKFEDMNRHLDFFQTMNRWVARQPADRSDVAER